MLVNEQKGRGRGEEENTNPGDELDESVVQGDSSIRIKDARSGVSEEISGHHLVLGVAHDSLQRLKKLSLQQTKK
jgi:hypothetical protein